MTSLPVVFVSGPFRAPDQWKQWQNTLAAGALGLAVWKLGAVALVPHLNSAFFQGAAPDEVWLVGDLALLAKCDAIIMTPDWERSSGARTERATAEGLGLPIFYELDTLRAWVEQR